MSSGERDGGCGHGGGTDSLCCPLQTVGSRPDSLVVGVGDFMQGGAGSVQEAVRRYVSEVKAQTFPQDDLHGY